MKLKTLAPVAAAAAIALTGCAGHHTAPATITEQTHVVNPSQADLRAQLGCTVASTGQENPEWQQVLPESDIKVDDLFGCVWSDHSRTLVAVQLGSDQAADTYFQDAVHSGQAAKYERDGHWVFIASDSMARYFAHEAYAKATA